MNLAMKKARDSILQFLKDNRNKALIVELEDSYVTIYNQKVKKNVTDDTWGRHQLLENAEDDLDKKTRQNKLNLSVEIDLKDRPGSWMPVNEFIENTSDIDIIRIQEQFNIL